MQHKTIHVKNGCKSRSHNWWLIKAIEQLLFFFILCRNWFTLIYLVHIQLQNLYKTIYLQNSQLLSCWLKQYKKLDLWNITKLKSSRNFIVDSSWNDIPIFKKLNPCPLPLKIGRKWPSLRGHNLWRIRPRKLSFFWNYCNLSLFTSICETNFNKIHRFNAREPFLKSSRFHHKIGEIWDFLEWP